MFDCKVCEEKDNRIKDLQSQLETVKSIYTAMTADLRRIALPPSTAQATISQMESNALWDGRDEVISLTPEQLKELEEEESERSRILSGTY